MNNTLNSIKSAFNYTKDYLKGFWEISNIQDERYCFIIENLEIIYRSTCMQTQISYMPVGCYRLFKDYTSDLNDETVCRKFKPDHARMIIGIDVLEKSLNFNNQEQVTVYLAYVKSCIKTLKMRAQ